MDREQLIEAWQTNHRINLRLIDATSRKGWRSSLSTRGGRDVGRQFAHIHDNRVWHLEKRAKDLAQGLTKFQSKDTPTKAAVKKAMKASTAAMEAYLCDVLEGKPKRRGFKKGLFTTLSYFVSHEAHHRGNILLTLKQSGNGLPRDVVYSIWDWDRI